MAFYGDEWPKKNHIIALDKNFVRYEFGDNENLNFIIAENLQTSCIDGAIGYLPSNRDKDNFDIWASMWLTRRKGSMPFLGAEIMNRMKGIINYRYLSGVGTNPKTALPLARDISKHHVYKLKHYYMLSRRDKYKIANIKTRILPQKPAGVPQTPLFQANGYDAVSSFINGAASRSIPLKDSWYINKRYFSHPIYRYLVWLISGAYEKSILVGREAVKDGVKILRIVDYIGNPDLLDGLYDAFAGLLDERGYEYIDFYIHGIDETHLRNAGFTLKNDLGGNVIPNYFEPFVPENIEIFGTSEAPCVRMCKADADQDRPNYSNPREFYE